MRSFKFPPSFLGTVLCLLASTAAFAEESDLYAIYGSEDFVSIATGQARPARTAPAVTSVITAADISRMGALDLDQVLETVPGLHVSVAPGGYGSIYAMRGIATEFNPQVLFLVNGTPITNFFLGNRGNIWGGMPVKAIARIEIIRGPGSALYGADAYAGIINIITKAASDIDTDEVGVYGGSFGTQGGWLTTAGNWNGIETALIIETNRTDGHQEQIDQDFESFINPAASLAPGPARTGRKQVELRLDMRKDNWRLRAGFQGRNDVGAGAGAASSLDDQGMGESQRINAEVSYDDPDFSENWEVKARVSYLDTKSLSDNNIFPAGHPGFQGEPVIGNPDVYERHYRLETSAFYHGFQDHVLRIGAGLHHGDMYRIRETKNFFQDANGQILPLLDANGQVVTQNVSNSAPFISVENRTITYAYLQDEWNFATDWTLTSGLRYDHYSDFGDTVNPRLALVWQADYNLTGKLLYGRAFRAPSFAEQFNINNPIAVGNPDVDPEVIDTVELALDYSISEDLRMGTNVFGYEARDLIRFEPVARNVGQQTGYGFEWEVSWAPSSDLRMAANYAFVRTEDKSTRESAGNHPTTQVYGQADWQFLPDWWASAHVNWVSGRRRVAGDQRPSLDDYTVTDLIFRRVNLWGHIELLAAVRNLFDADVREPSQFQNGLAAIPGDFPLAGRNVYLELKYNF